MQPAVGKGLWDDAIAAHPPVLLSAARRQLYLVGRLAQSEQMAAVFTGTPYEE